MFTTLGLQYQRCEPDTEGVYRRQVGLCRGNMQRCALVIVPDVDVHSSLDVAPHECHVALKDALAQLIRHPPVRLVHAAACSM